MKNWSGKLCEITSSNGEVVTLKVMESPEGSLNVALFNESDSAVNIAPGLELCTSSYPQVSNSSCGIYRHR